MHILFDGTQCDFSANTLGEAVTRAVDHASTTGRVIIEVSVDGQAVDIDSGFQEDMTPTEVAFTSLTPDELLLATLDLGERAIESAQRNFDRAAELIQAGDSVQAHQELKQGIDLWKTVEETVFREVISEMPHQDQALDERIAELRTSLNSIMEAIAKNDLAALSDTLLYEFPQTSEGCTSLLKACSATITEAMTDKTEPNE